MKKAVAAPVLLMALGLATAASADGSLAIVLGTATGPAVQFSGGNAQVLQQAGGGGGQMSAGKTVYVPLSLEVGTGAPAGFYKWVSDSASGSGGGAKSFELDSFDATGKNTSILKIQSAVITNVAFPAVSKTDSSAATIHLQMSEQSSSTGGTPHAFEKQSPVAWTKSSFDATLTGVPGATSAIGASSIVFVMPAMTSSTGQVSVGAPQLHPFHLIFDASATKALQMWQGQAKTGATTAAAAKDAKIVYHGTAGRGEKTTSDLFTITFGGCAPMSVTPSGASVDVEMECKVGKLASTLP